MTGNDYEMNNRCDSRDSEIYEPIDVLASGCMKLMMVVVICIVVLVLFGLFTSCTTTKYVPVIEYQTDTLIQTKVTHDSIYINDSTVITEKGDTVRIEKWHTKYVLQELHDTTYISKTDSVPAPYPVTEYVEKELTWWQTERLHLANIVLYLLAIVCGYWLARLIWK